MQTEAFHLGQVLHVAVLVRGLRSPVPLGKALSWGGALEAKWLRICSVAALCLGLPGTRSNSNFFVVIRSGGD